MKPVKATWRDRGGLPSLEVDCPPTGEVDVLVRGAGGMPLADRAVQVIAALGPRETRMRVPVQFDGRTDAGGRFRMRWSEGIRRLRVAVPGEGYGSTGTLRGAGRPCRAAGDAAAGPIRLDRGPAGPEAGGAVGDGRPGESGRSRPRCRVRPGRPVRSQRSPAGLVPPAACCAASGRSPPS